MAEHPDLAALREAIVAGGDPNLRDEDGRTLLHHAIAAQDATRVSFLLDSGADLEAKDAEGYPPTRVMFQEKHSPWGISFDVRHGYTKLRDQILDMLIQGRFKASLTFINQGQLYTAVHNGEVARVMEALTEADVTNLDIRLDDGTTPLHLAARGGHARIVKILLQGKAPRDARDQAGRTPLDVARDAGHAKVMELLHAPLVPAPESASAIDDRIVAATIAQIRDVYALEPGLEPLRNVVFCGDEVSCVVVMLNVPDLDPERTAVGPLDGARRIEGRFVSEDDAAALSDITGLHVMSAVDVVMDRVCAKLEGDLDGWRGVPHEQQLVVLYTNHFSDHIVQSRRVIAAQTRTASVDDYLQALTDESNARAGT